MAKRRGVRIASINGGDRDNSIPWEASAVIVVPKAKVADLEKFVSAFGVILKSELEVTGPRLNSSLNATDRPAKVMNVKAPDMMLVAIHGTVNGALRMRDGRAGAGGNFKQHGNVHGG